MNQNILFMNSASFLCFILYNSFIRPKNEMIMNFTVKYCHFMYQYPVGIYRNDYESLLYVFNIITV